MNLQSNAGRARLGFAFARVAEFPPKLFGPARHPEYAFTANPLSGTVREPAASKGRVAIWTINRHRPRISICFFSLSGLEPLRGTLIPTRTAGVKNHPIGSVIAVAGISSHAVPTAQGKGPASDRVPAELPEVSVVIAVMAADGVFNVAGGIAMGADAIRAGLVTVRRVTVMA